VQAQHLSRCVRGLWSNSWRRRSVQCAKCSRHHCNWRCIQQCTCVQPAADTSYICIWQPSLAHGSGGGGATNLSLNVALGFGVVVLPKGVCSPYLSSSSLSWSASAAPAVGCWCMGRSMIASLPAACMRCVYVTMDCSTAQHTARHRTAHGARHTEHSTAHTARHRTPHHSTKYSTTTQHSTQHTTAQHTTARHSTAQQQHSTVRQGTTCICFLIV
jgi:hypothetical protein